MTKTEAETRAYVLANAAEDQLSSTAVDRAGLFEEAQMWRIGSLRFWKSEAAEKSGSTRPFPSYRRGSLRMALFPDMRFEVEPFTSKDGRSAFAIVLRSEKNPDGTFGTFTFDETEAKRITSLLNAEMDAARTFATERFRANGGDPAAVASLRAPSRAEMFEQLNAVLGNPDDE